MNQNANKNIPPHHQWFAQARYGMFIHWGPYAQFGRGEQVLFRERLDQREYTERAMAWKPRSLDLSQWARHAKDGGFRYAVFTTRHHDGFAMWPTGQYDYHSVNAFGRDVVGEYVEAFRSQGLRVGLYYSLADWRQRAYWLGPKDDPTGFERFRGQVFAQVRELLTNYGKIDVIWFDGPWPHNAASWHSSELIDMIRSLQPNILINNRLDCTSFLSPAVSIVDPEAAGESKQLGDFGTPEHHVTADPNRMWESCQTSTRRLWGYTTGEYWRGVDELLSNLCEVAARGGNLLLNVGPDADGRFPEPFLVQSKTIGDWLRVNHEAIFNTTDGNTFEFITRGYVTTRHNEVYLILRFWDGGSEITLAPLATPVTRATLLTPSGDQSLGVTVRRGVTTITGLPATPPVPYFPVMKLTCASQPAPHDWAVRRLWSGDPRRMADWATT
ncbi:MAG: alpha-L-fucosidase [Phycisphaera sp.]|nr:alpha-L-fucosidase [Phycisphaera sp.]